MPKREVKVLEIETRQVYGFDIFGGTLPMGQDNGFCVWQEEVRVRGIKGDSHMFA